MTQLKPEKLDAAFGSDFWLPENLCSVVARGFEEKFTTTAWVSVPFLN